MKIKRNIDGREIEIELTAHEMWDAYIEKQHQFDVEDIEDYFYGCEDDELIEKYLKTGEEIKQLYEAIANEMRRNIDKYDMDWQYAREEAIHQILSNT